MDTHTHTNYKEYILTHELSRNHGFHFPTRERCYINDSLTALRTKEHDLNNIAGSRRDLYITL